MMKIPYVNLADQNVAIKNELLAAVDSVISSGQYILGKEVTDFEHHFAELCGVKYAVGVGTGTDALILALRALEIGPGSEVITVANSFVSTASCIVQIGAQPVFIDVTDDYTMAPSLIEKAITPRTRAILPVHLTGRPADMELIMAIAQAHDLEVIEDCAQAVCAEYKKQKVGSFGKIGCFSLHPLKNLSACGDGGVLTTNDVNLYKKLLILRANGIRTRDDCVAWSDNSRLDTLQAALLLVKLDYLDEWTEKRRGNARFYQQHLADLPQVQVPLDKPYEKSVYHTFVIQADRRDALRDFLGKHGIDTKVHYPVPIHLQPAAKELGYKKGSLPVTERQAKRVLSLPVYPELGQEKLSYIVNCIHDFYKIGAQ
jgi:dTDP-4-amino-4,6-dideoxygalactose transaminase